MVAPCRVVEGNNKRFTDARYVQADERACESGQEVEVGLSRLKDELLEGLAQTQVRRYSLIWVLPVVAQQIILTHCPE